MSSERHDFSKMYLVKTGEILIGQSNKMVVFSDDKIVHVRRRVVVRATAHFVALFVKLVEDSCRGRRRRRQSTSFKNATHRRPVRFGHRAVVRRVHDRRQVARTVADRFQRVRVERVWVCSQPPLAISQFNTLYAPFCFLARLPKISLNNL